MVRLLRKHPLLAGVALLAMVVTFPRFASQSSSASSRPFRNAASSADPGYWLVASDGGIFSFGDAKFEGSTGSTPLNKPIVGMAPSVTGNGYWLVASDGGIFSFGDAKFAGSTGAISLNKPIVGMAPTASGNGYWLVASDGGIFSFGDAKFAGSTGAISLNKPIVGMAPTASGNGYWLVASDGGIFSFGDAKFAGSTGAISLNKPIVGMAPSASGNGYWLVASDGGIFSFGDAKFEGSTGSTPLNKPIVGMAPSVTGNGYWLVASDGGIFSFGNAKFEGSTGSTPLNKPIVGMAAPYRSFVVGAAGDIACQPPYTVTATTCRHMSTSDLVLNGFDAIVLLGDIQYENGSLSYFNSSYDPTWGRKKSITYPAPGNHEYSTAAAAGYFDYWNGVGSQVGQAGERSKGYYAFDLGSKWRLYAVNSNCSNVGGCGVGSAQYEWIKSDLEQNPRRCVAAFWHHPRFSSGVHGNDVAMQPIWQALYDANAELVLSGHDHVYERFAPQTPSGTADNARGIQEFVVGTGGKDLTTFGAPVANSEVRNSNTFGILKLGLQKSSYQWTFLPEAGRTFTDSGTRVCH